VALRDTEQRRFAAILTTLSTPVPFESDLTQTEIKKKQRWTGKEKTIEHLLDGFFIVRLNFSFFKIINLHLRCIIVRLKIHRMLLF
jgi:hypothetical protein